MLVKTYGSALSGIDAITITIEVDVCEGICFYMVGLPDSAVKESHQRIDAAFRQYGFRIPGRRIVVNLAPADIRKEGSAYDLPIAVGILAATGQIKPRQLDRFLLMGELSLDGSLIPVRGALSVAVQARKEGFSGILLPVANAREAAVVEGIGVYGVATLADVTGFLCGTTKLLPVENPGQELLTHGSEGDGTDFSDVKGQENAKRALEVAAAGGHNLLMTGSPGSGKTMLARRLPGILPKPTLEEAIEITRIYSVAGMLPGNSGILTNRPFRNPHHTISATALTGGGSVPRPGEVSLAHHGVLFLDELPEFGRHVLEALRQPLEDRKVTISRARQSLSFPAGFMLIAAMNPCPCGYHGHPKKDCVCPEPMVKKYLNRLSGPLLDRIDLHIEVAPVSCDALQNNHAAEASLKVAQRVDRARRIQWSRFRGHIGLHCNAQMGHAQIRKYCQIDGSSNLMLRSAMDRLHLSARAYMRILKLARTIADLESSPDIQVQHLAEAIHYRSLDRERYG